MTALSVDRADAVRDHIRDRIHDARARGTALRLAGRGNWLDAGRPVRASETLSTRELSGIVEYVPGDLTITARAGTTLDEIRDTTAAHGQWLALDPNGTPDGTIGATLATASTGPLSTFFGGPRDLALGVEFVSGAGVLARGGGRVVKNVAGFDLTRLLTGSWGTLAVVTEITFRLHARPEADETLVARLPASADDIDRLGRALRRLPFTPLACEVVNAAFAAHLVGGSDPAVLIRIGGNGDAVRAQRAAFGELASVTEIDAGVWTKFRTAEPPGALVVRLSSAQSEIARTWREATALTAPCAGAFVHARPTRGVARCIIPSSDASAIAVRAAFSSTMKATRIGERLPADLWPVCSPPPTADRVSRGIKAAFDPANVLNPGIFGELS